MRTVQEIADQKRPIFDRLSLSALQSQRRIHIDALAHITDDTPILRRIARGNLSAIDDCLSQRSKR